MKARTVGFLFWFSIVMAVANVWAALVFHDWRFFIWALAGVFSAHIYRLVLKKGEVSGGKS